MKRKCAQSGASPLTCRFHSKTSGSILLEQRVALMLHCYAVAGWSATDRHVSSRPMDRTANRPTSEIISKLRSLRPKKFKRSSFDLDNNPVNHIIRFKPKCGTIFVSIYISTFIKYMPIGVSYSRFKKLAPPTPTISYFVENSPSRPAYLI